VKINENNIFTVVISGSSVFTVVLAMAGFFIFSWPFAAGVIAGGVVAIANCFWLKSILQRAMGLSAHQAVRFAQLRYGIRLGIIAVIVSLLIIYCKINALGLILGLSVVVITIIAMTIYLATLDGG
jgi:hypothetical protein